MFRSWQLCVVVFLWAACVTGFAQTVSGDLTGTIYDASGATVPGATIVAKNDATGVETTTASTPTGQYRISNLPVGTYTLSVSTPGFSKAEIKGVAVELNKIATKNITLQVGTIAEVVEVTSAPPTIDTTTAVVQSSFEPTQIMDLPTTASGSGVINLSLLNAGVATSGATGLGTGPSVGGQRPRNNNFTVEGVDNNSKSVTGPLVTIPNDAVAEFTVQQNQFSAEVGHSSGGQFNQIVKSGTNELHGMAYEYLQNRNLNAANNLDAVDGNPLHPRYDNNRFGGNFGGPIKKNKMFFFVGYEYNPVGSSGSAGLVYAPTANGYSTLSSISGISQTNLGILKQYLGTASTAISASTCCSGAYPLVGPGNASLGAQNAATAKSVELGQISISAPSYANYEAGLASFDYNISDKDNLRSRFVLNRSGFIDTSASLPVFYTTVPSNNYLVTFSEYHTFAPTLMNEFRAGYNRYSNNYPSGNFSFQGLDQFPNITLYELGGVNIGPDPNAPQFGIQNTYQLTDNVNWTRGNHSFKFGVDGWKSISPQSFVQRARGDYEWSYLSDYLFDYYPDYIAQRSLGSSPYYGDQILMGFYGNDSWKIRPNVTVNLGLRYEYETIPYTERLQTLNAVSNVPGLITFGEPQPMTNALMPRVGIAYSPGRSGNTSIRAGFGINYDVLYDNQGLLTLPPQFNTTVDVTGLDKGGFLAGGGIPPSSPLATHDVAYYRAGTGGYIPDQTRPKSLQWNLGFQHVFAQNYTVETRYLGTRGINLPMQIQLNRQPVVNAQDALPVYFSAPSQATLDSLTNTLANVTDLYNAQGNIIPAYLNAGFTGIITSYQPTGNSIYHGWANQITRRFSNGLQFVGSYTFSHAIDDSTADVFSTYTTPRRPQDAQNLRLERSSSALDHRNRLTFQAIYDLPFFKHSNWLMRNVVGNWEFAPIYTYQTGTLVTIQSGTDSNLNGDSAGDRTIINPNGDRTIGSGTTALKNSAGQTVAFLVNNPNAMYVAAPKGTIATGGRNTEHLRPIDNVDFSIAKRINVTERHKLEFSTRFLNFFNHPQYTGGYINDVAPIGFTGGAVHNFLIPTSSLFGQPMQVFSSNPRTILLSFKYIF